jgi:hypothetical protein
MGTETGDSGRPDTPKVGSVIPGVFGDRIVEEKDIPSLRDRLRSIATRARWGARASGTSAALLYPGGLFVGSVEVGAGNPVTGAVIFAAGEVAAVGLTLVAKRLGNQASLIDENVGRKPSIVKRIRNKFTR